MAASASKHSDVSMVCAALRERPKPVLMSASPSAARGTSAMRTIQRTKLDSEECQRGGHPCSPRRTRWERTRSPRPIALPTATPAAINAARNGAVPRRAMVAIIEEAKPATSINKPASFMEEPSGPGSARLDVSANNSVKSMNSAWTFNGPMGTRGRSEKSAAKASSRGLRQSNQCFLFELEAAGRLLLSRIQWRPVLA